MPPVTGFDDKQLSMTNANNISAWEGGRDSALHRDSLMDGSSDGNLNSPGFRSKQSTLTGARHGDAGFITPDITLNNKSFGATKRVTGGPTTGGKLNTIQEGSNIAAKHQLRTGYKTAVNDKFIKTTTQNWNKGNYLSKNGAANNISDFKGVVGGG